MRKRPLLGLSICYDALATRAIYQAIRTAPPVRCECMPCTNWFACSPDLLPVGFRNLAVELGIDLDFPAEVYHLARESVGSHLYGGWFHLVGEIVGGTGAGTGELVFDSFTVAFHDRLALVDQHFVRESCIQMEFSGCVPWSLTAPEPD